MATEPEEIPGAWSDLDSEDLWVRGWVYARFKRSLEEAQVQLHDLENKAARARYEYEIVQRIRDRMTDADARQDWEIHASVAHDIVVMAQCDLAEVADSADYYRAMVAEIEADLGDKAQEYAALLTQFDLEEEWDEEEFEDFDEEEFEALGFVPIPFLDDADVPIRDDWEDEEDEDDGMCEETPL